MRLASIDIGTNTILLLIAEIAPDSTIKTLHEEQVVARLGKGVDAHRVILPETFQRVKNFLLDYKSICKNFSVDKIIAVGTSALRDAKNNYELCTFIKNETEISIEILSGNEEAHWTFLGGIYGFETRAENFSVIDIGGGSTEIVFGSSQQVHNKTSLDIGSVRLTERFLKNSPPKEDEISAAINYISDLFRKEIFSKRNETFYIGVSGTFTTLGCIVQNLPSYVPENVAGYELTYENICTVYQSLKQKSKEEIASLPQITTGREDIIFAGTLILKCVMEMFEIKSIFVSNKGLRYGVIIREVEKLK